MLHAILLTFVCALPQEKASSLRVEPAKLDFGELARGARKVENLAVVNDGKANVKLMSIGELGKGVRVRVLDKDGNELLGADGRGTWNRIVMPGASITLEVTVDAITPGPTFRRKVILYTDEPTAPKVPLVVSFSITASSPAPAGTEKRPLPHLKLDKDEIQFGTLLAGEDPKIAVKLENTGDADLIITKIQASCGCTEPRLVTQTRTVTAKQLDALTAQGMPIKLAAKETAALETHLVSKGLLGEVLKEIMITSNDPVAPTHPIQVRAHLEQGYKLQPGALLFGKVNQGAATTASLNLVADYLPQLEIITVTPPDPTMQVKVTKVDGPYLTYRIDCTLPADAPANALQHALVLATNHALVPEIIVPVLGEMSLSVLFDAGGGNADRLDFGWVKEGEGAVRDVRIDNLEPGTPYPIERVEIDSKVASFLKQELITVEPGKKYRLRVTVSTDMPKGHFLGTINVFSSHPHLPRKDLKILGFIGQP